jgi:ion channel-forming bestrophin family protein
MRLYGSILPEMILPLLFVGAWAALIVIISIKVHTCKFEIVWMNESLLTRSVAVNQVLLTVTGFVVALGLSFRSTTAYERYGEGRRYWTQLKLASLNLARVIWIHAAERKEADLSKKDLMHKLTGLNLIKAFSVALKHRLRFEPYTMYEDLHGLVCHLDTYAHDATKVEAPTVNMKKNPLRVLGQYLGVTFAESNPMKQIKRSNLPLGNLPLEILSYLSSYVDELVENGQLKTPAQLIIACKCCHYC